MRFILIAFFLVALAGILIVMYPVKKPSPNCTQTCGCVGMQKKLFKDTISCIGLPLPHTCNMLCEGK